MWIGAFEIFVIFPINGGRNGGGGACWQFSCSKCFSHHWGSSVKSDMLRHLLLFINDYLNILPFWKFCAFLQAYLLWTVYAGHMAMVRNWSQFLTIDFIQLSQFQTVALETGIFARANVYMTFIKPFCPDTGVSKVVNWELQYICDLWQTVSLCRFAVL
jgi:hypothetical protein